MNQCVYTFGWFGSGGNGLSVSWGDGTNSPNAHFTDAQRGQSCASEMRSHTYTSPGVYTITATGWHPGPTDAPETDWVYTTTVTVITDASTPLTTPVITLTSPSAGIHVIQGGIIPVAWSAQGVSSDAAMYIQLVGTDGSVIKSQKVDYSSGSTSINTGDFCNQNFSDAIDGNCNVLRSRVAEKQLTSYRVRAAIYTPANACFGYCARPPGTPETRILKSVDGAVFSILPARI